MSWDEPTQEELDDAIVEDTVHCARCGVPHVLPEGHLSGERSICEECTDEEIAGLIAERDEWRSRAEAAEARRGRYSLDRQDGPTVCWTNGLRIKVVGNHLVVEPAPGYTLQDASSPPAGFGE
jgi:hypothetical protein